MISKPTKRLIEIDHAMRDLARAAFAGEISYYTAICKAQKLEDEAQKLEDEAQKLEDEKVRLWLLERGS